MSDEPTGVVSSEEWDQLEKRIFRAPSNPKPFKLPVEVIPCEDDKVMVVDADGQLLLACSRDFFDAINQKYSSL